MPSPEQIKAAAESDAKFDGREFRSLGRLERERYLERARRALEAAEAVASGAAA